MIAARMYGALQRDKVKQEARASWAGLPSWSLGNSSSITVIPDGELKMPQLFYAHSLVDSQYK